MGNTTFWTTTESTLKVIGMLAIAVDDPVEFARSTEVKEVLPEFIAKLSGPGVTSSMVTIDMEAVVNDYFARIAEANSDGGRRLIGVVNIHFQMTVPYSLRTDALNNLEMTSSREGMAHASEWLKAELRARGRLDLTSVLFVQKLSASEPASTTTTTFSSVQGCPQNRLCFSHSCDSCSYWRLQGQECQEITDFTGECICSCYVLLSNWTHSRPGPPTRASTDASRRDASCIIPFILLVTAFLTSPERC